MDPEILKLVKELVAQGGGGSVLFVVLLVVGYAVRKGYVSFGNGKCPAPECKNEILKAVSEFSEESRTDRQAIRAEISTLTGYVKGWIERDKNA
jgi:ribosomal protein S5